MGTEPYLDVHQHLWPAPFVEALRRRSAPPMLRGWTLHTAGEPPYEVRPDDHDPVARAELDRAATRVLVSLSSPLGIESLPPAQAQPLLDAWHDGVRALSDPFTGWASLTRDEPDLDGLKQLFADGLCGVQVPATDLTTPAELEALAPVLRRCEELNRPVLVHPGPVSTPSRTVGEFLPWWPAVVDYPAQLAAAWWSWIAVGRSLVPDLRICFVAGAGLAPLQHERFTARADGARLVVDPNTFVETSSYRRQGVDGLVRALGIDVIVLGSDRPYAAAELDPHLGAAAIHAIAIDNPIRLLGKPQGERP
ncbi:MAG: amidohydrolase [Jatrophihabitantaceae bacterium]